MIDLLRQEYNKTIKITGKLWNINQLPTLYLMVDPSIIKDHIFQRWSKLKTNQRNGYIHIKRTIDKVTNMHKDTQLPQR